MGLRIVTDSTADLPQAIIEKYNITVVPLKVIMNGETLVAGVDIDTPTFYKRLKQEKELPTTAQVNPIEFYTVFKEIIEQGDDILGIFISSEMSGTAQSAHIAKSDLGVDNIYLVDSQTVTFELGFLVNYAAELANQGVEIDEIIAKVQDLKAETYLYAVIDTLEYLVKGGRIKPTVGAIGTALQLKPIITIKDGLVESIGKQRGRKKAYRFIQTQMEENNQTLNGKIVFIGHSNAPEYLEEFKTWINENWTPKAFVETEIGPIVGVHAGPGCVGMVVVDD